MNTPNTLLPNWLTRCAENHPAHLAVQCEQEQWSFAELNRRAIRLARQLATLNVQEGDRVALLGANSIGYVACVHALTYLGAILVPLNTRLSVEELGWQVGDVHAMLLISDASSAALAAEIAQVVHHLPRATLAGETAGDETVLSQLPETDVPLRTLIDLSTPQAILYTSGTTGTPKGAIITYSMQWWNAVGSALNLGHHPDDRWLACLPLFHIGGLSILMRSVIYGISVIVHQKFDPTVVNKAIWDDNISIISVVAVMLQRMLTALDARNWVTTRVAPTIHGFADEPVYSRGHPCGRPLSGRPVPARPGYPSTLRCILLGGGPAPRPLLEDCMSRNIPVVQTYGLTEACSQAVTLAPADALRKLGSAGRPLPPVQLRILHNGQPTSPHEPGEIFLKGPTITPGYVDRPDATAAAFSDGWFATGDIGYLDDEGFLYVLDRRADLIISGGENVYPAEIEAALMTHPDVVEAGVCGQDDAEWGQVPIAFVHVRSESTVSTEELMSYAAKCLARYKQPRAIHLIDHLPRNASGKLLRRELRRLIDPQV